MNHTQRLAVLYADHDGERDTPPSVPSVAKVRRCLQFTRTKDTSPTDWKAWKTRDVLIDCHYYSRNRDWNRALRQNDFNLARALDQAAA